MLIYVQVSAPESSLLNTTLYFTQKRTERKKKDRWHRVNWGFKQVHSLLRNRFEFCQIRWSLNDTELSSKSSSLTLSAVKWKLIYIYIYVYHSSTFLIISPQKKLASGRWNSRCVFLQSVSCQSVICKLHCVKNGQSAAPCTASLNAADTETVRGSVVKNKLRHLE